MCAKKYAVDMTLLPTRVDYKIDCGFKLNCILLVTGISNLKIHFNSAEFSTIQQFIFS
jgi:hypothetical protein